MSLYFLFPYFPLVVINPYSVFNINTLKFKNCKFQFPIKILDHVILFAIIATQVSMYVHDCDWILDNRPNCHILHHLYIFVIILRPDCNAGLIYFKRS